MKCSLHATEKTVRRKEWIDGGHFESTFRISYKNDVGRRWPEQPKKGFPIQNILFGLSQTMEIKMP